MNVVARHAGLGRRREETTCRPHTRVFPHGPRRFVRLRPDPRGRSANEPARRRRALARNGRPKRRTNARAPCRSTATAATARRGDRSCALPRRRTSTSAAPMRRVACPRRARAALATLDRDAVSVVASSEIAHLEVPPAPRADGASASPRDAAPRARGDPPRASPERRHGAPGRQNVLRALERRLRAVQCRDALGDLRRARDRSARALRRVLRSRRRGWMRWGSRASYRRARCRTHGPAVAPGSSKSPSAISGIPRRAPAAAARARRRSASLTDPRRVWKRTASTARRYRDHRRGHAVVRLSANNGRLHCRAAADRACASGAARAFDQRSAPSVARRSPRELSGAPGVSGPPSATGSQRRAEF